MNYGAFGNPRRFLGEVVRRAKKTGRKVAATGSYNDLGNKPGVVQYDAAQSLSAGARDQALANLGLPLGSIDFGDRLINGDMRIAQRGTSATVTAGTAVPTASAGYPCVDRWYVYSTGANVTAAQVAGSGEDQYDLQITGALSVTAVGIGQRIESKNIADLAGQTVMLGVNISNALLTPVTWAAYYSNTTDTFGTIADGLTKKTLIASNTWTVSGGKTRYTALIALPSQAANGVEIVLTVGAQTSGTWKIGRARLGPVLAGAVNEPRYQRRPISYEFNLCQRHYQTQSIALDFYSGGAGTVGTQGFNFYMFAAPSAALANVGYTYGVTLPPTLSAGSNVNGLTQATATTTGRCSYYATAVFSAEVP